MAPQQNRVYFAGLESPLRDAERLTSVCSRSTIQRARGRNAVVQLGRALPFWGLVANTVFKKIKSFEESKAPTRRRLVGRRAIETISYTQSALHLRILVKEV